MCAQTLIVMGQNVQNNVEWKPLNHGNGTPNYAYEGSAPAKNGFVNITLGKNYKKVHTPEGVLYTFNHDKNGDWYERRFVPQGQPSTGNSKFDVFCKVTEETLQKRKDTFAERTKKWPNEQFTKKISDYLNGVNSSQLKRGKWIPFSEYYDFMQYVVSNPIEKVAKAAKRI